MRRLRRIQKQPRAPQGGKQAAGDGARVPQRESVPVWGVSLEEVVSEPGVERGLRAGQVEREAWVALKLFGPRTPLHT